MKKTTIKFMVDILMFLSMAAIIGIGLLIKYTLISGTERWIKYNNNIDLTFWGMDRHEWGAIHLIIGFVFIGLLVIHLFLLNGKTIQGLLNRFIKQKTTRAVFSILLILLGFALMLGPLFVSPVVNPTEPGSGRYFPNHEQIEKQGTTNKNYPKSVTKGEKIKNSNYSSVASIEIKGYMTLKEVSQKYHVPTIYIKERLTIPNSISDNSKLGHLKRRYNFEMNEVKNIIIKHSNKQ